MPTPRLAAARKSLTGTVRPSRERARAPSERLATVPRPPAELSALARGEWKRLAPVAHDLGTLTGADLRAFRLLCETLATEQQAREALARDGMTTPTSDGGLKTHPACKIMETARSQAARLLADFGMTPRGRNHVDPAPAVMASPWDDL